MSAYASSGIDREIQCLNHFLKSLVQRLLWTLLLSLY